MIRAAKFSVERSIPGDTDPQRCAVAQEGRRIEQVVEPLLRGQPRDDEHLQHRVSAGPLVSAMMSRGSAIGSRHNDSIGRRSSSDGPVAAGRNVAGGAGVAGATGALRSRHDGVPHVAGTGPLGILGKIRGDCQDRVRTAHHDLQQCWSDGAHQGRPHGAIVQRHREEHRAPPGQGQGRQGPGAQSMRVDGDRLRRGAHALPQCSDRAQVAEQMGPVLDLHGRLPHAPTPAAASSCFS